MKNATMPWFARFAWKWKRAPTTGSSCRKGLKREEGMLGTRITILDACVLVRAPLRDTLLRGAEPPSLYQPLWSEEIIIEMEWVL